MKRTRLSLAMLALGCILVLGGSANAAASAALVSRSPDIAETLERWIAVANLPILHWPIFIDYQGSVQRFYRPTGYALVWSNRNGPTPTALAIIDQFQHADLKGLRPKDYDDHRWAERIALVQSDPTINDRASFDLALTVCLMRFISDLHNGRVNPRAVNFKLNVDQKKYDLPVLLRNQFINARPADVPRLIEDVEPPYDGYRRLEKALQLYVPIADHYHGAPLPPPGKTIEEGDSYAGLPQMFDFLKTVGDLPAAVDLSVDPPIYQGPLIQAVESFQTRHGLEPDGRLGPATIRAMKVPLSDRVEQIRLALERWRWLPINLSEPPIVVNVPEFMLRAYGPDNTLALRMRVVVGGAFQHRTPIFTAKLSTVVFRPYWRVPYEIQHRELIPRIERNPSYLKDHDYEVVAPDGSVVTDGRVSDDVLDELRAGDLLIRQKPGDKNALGFVKFVFPNPYDIYMHGTPTVSLFDKSRRDASHGCIRLEDPVAVAEWVLRNQPPGWDRSSIIGAMQDGPDNVPVTVRPPIPVMIVYGTARAGQDGKLYFFDDIYGYDAELERVLARGYPYP